MAILSARIFRGCTFLCFEREAFQKSWSFCIGNQISPWPCPKDSLILIDISGVKPARAGQARRTPLILRRPFDVVDDEEADGGVGGFEFQAELGFEGVAEGGDVVGDGGVFRSGIVHPGKG